MEAEDQHGFVKGVFHAHQFVKSGFEDLPGVREVRYRPVVCWIGSVHFLSSGAKVASWQGLGSTLRRPEDFHSTVKNAECSVGCVWRSSERSRSGQRAFFVAKLSITISAICWKAESTFNNLRLRVFVTWL